MKTVARLVRDLAARRVRSRMPSGPCAARTAQSGVFEVLEPRVFASAVFHGGVLAMPGIAGSDSSGVYPGEMSGQAALVVLGKQDGVIFVPPHLAEKVVKTSEIVRLRDTFGKLRLSEGKYTPGQIDARWTDDIEVDFSGWLEVHMDELSVPKSAIQELLKERTW